MDRLAALRVFTAVVESGSFSRTAQRLGLSKSAVSKHVTALEESLGARLLNRTTRRLAPTDAGEEYYRRGTRILAELQEADAAIQEKSKEPRGRLRISAPMSFGIRHLGDAVAVFLRRHPHIQIDLALSDRYVDLVAERFDVAIRIGRLKDSSLHSRVLAPLRMVMCASPAYLKARGTPRKPADLGAHVCLTYTYADGSTSWRLKGRTMSVTGVAHADNGDILRQLALAGLGIVIQPSFIVGPDVAKGKLVSLMPEHIAQDGAIHAVYPATRHVSGAVRLFIDFMAERCGPVPYWEAAKAPAA
jgi:DNA-binding transcriptional LysR family regulator